MHPTCPRETAARLGEANELQCLYSANLPWESCSRRTDTIHRAGQRNSCDA